MFFAARIFTAIFLSSFLLLQEFFHRKAKNLEPSSFRQLLSKIDQKSKKSLYAKTWRPLVLALTSYFFFCVWEFLVFYMFARNFLIPTLFLGAGCIIFVIYLRSQKLKNGEFQFRFWDLILWTVGWGLIFEVAFSYVLLVWVVYRARFLRLSQKKQENS